MNYPSVSKFSPAAGIITQSQLNDYWTWTNNVFVFNLLDKPAFYYDFRSSIIKGFKNSRWSIFIEQNTIYGRAELDTRTVWLICLMKIFNLICMLVTM